MESYPVAALTYISIYMTCVTSIGVDCKLNDVNIVQILSLGIVICHWKRIIRIKHQV